MLDNFYTHKSTIYFMQRVLGYLCLLLSPVCVGLGFLGMEYNEPNFWYSISDTYYATSKICMIGLLFTTSVFFFCYRGYDKVDKIITNISSLSALGVILFPCMSVRSNPREGLFNIPIHTCHTLHCISAMLLFATFVVIIGFRFTKSEGFKTVGKRRRNRLYIACAIIIAIFMVSQAVTTMMQIPYMTIVNETVMLTAFGIAWLTKSKRFKSLND